MLNLGANLSLGFLDLAYHFVQYVAFAMFFCKRCAGPNHTPKSRAVLLSSTAPLFTNPYLPFMNPDASTSLCAC